MSQLGLNFFKLLFFFSPVNFFSISISISIFFSISIGLWLVFNISFFLLLKICFFFSFVSIKVYESCNNKSCWALSQFRFLSFVTIWFLFFSGHFSFFFTIFDFLIQKYLSHLFHHKHFYITIFLPKNIFFTKMFQWRANVIWTFVLEHLKCTLKVSY